MKLTGSSVTDAFYYLTLPSGDQDAPTIKVFTILSDLYDRETWQCDGVRSAGTLLVKGNLRLTFTPCGQSRVYCDYYAFYPETNTIGEFMFRDVCGRPVPEISTFFPTLPPTNAAELKDKPKPPPAPEPEPVPSAYFIVTSTSWRVAGEPSQEKVTYFRYLAYGDPEWDDVELYGGYWNTGCVTFYWRSRTWRTPTGCAWYYQY
jgi:hypothetical protein